MGIIDGATPRGAGVEFGFGKRLYVNTATGVDTDSGSSWASALDTIAAALAVAADNDEIYVYGDVREEVLSPLGIQGGKIIGMTGGRTRHDDGVRWREPASGATTGGALLTLREQGWEVHNILFVPKSDATALRLRRAEDATYPDGSHAIVRGCKFIGAATATTVGIEDHGGSHHDLIEDCEFHTLATAIKNTVGAGIASPLRWKVLGNVFEDCTNAVDLPANASIVKGNIFGPGTVIVDTGGGTAGGNFVIDNYFPDAEADIDNAHGYTGHASDSIWRNFSTNTAAMTVGIPGA